MLNKLDIVSKINETYSRLGKAERKVATVILNDLEFAANASITELADKAQVSAATITRFAKAIDCKDVRNLKVQLAQSIGVGQRFIDDAKIPPTGIHGLYNLIKKALDDNSQLLSEDTIYQAVDSLADARQILVFGVGGGSTILAAETQYRLFRLGYPATAYSDPMLMRMAAASISNKDALICLSLTGYSPDVLEAAEIAKQYDIPVLAITRRNSPLGDAADILLPVEHEETDYIFSPSTARYAMLAVIDVLATELAEKRKRTSREKLRRIKFALDHHRNGGNRLPLGD